MPKTTDHAPLARHANQTPLAQTQQQQRLFLAALAHSGTIKAAAHVAEIKSLNQVYAWASASVVFAKSFDIARNKGEKALLLKYEEHLDATLLPEQGMPIEDFSRTQISRMFRMKRLDPRYRDNAPAVTVNVGPVAIQFAMQVQVTDEAERPTK